MKVERQKYHEIPTTCFALKPKHVLIEFRYQIPSTRGLPRTPIWQQNGCQGKLSIHASWNPKWAGNSSLEPWPQYVPAILGGHWGSLMMKSFGTKVKHFAGEATDLMKLTLYLEIGRSMLPYHRNPQGMWMWMNLVKQWKNQEAKQMLHAHFPRSCTTAKGSYRKISTNRLKTSSSWFLLQRPSLSFPKAAFHTMLD